MSVKQEAAPVQAICGSTFVCSASLEDFKVRDIAPVMEKGTEILHILSGPGIYEVYAKMDGLLYSYGDEVQLVMTRNGNVMLRNQENENERMLFAIPEWLFHQDFVPADMT